MVLRDVGKVCQHQLSCFLHSLGKDSLCIHLVPFKSICAHHGLGASVHSSAINLATCPISLNLSAKHLFVLWRKDKMRSGLSYPHGDSMLHIVLLLPLCEIKGCVRKGYMI